MKQTATVTSTVTFDDLLIKMLPRFQSYARRLQRRFKHFDVDDTVQDLVGMALQMYRSLQLRGKQAFYSPIMKFAIKRFRDGRRFVGQNKTDALAVQTQMLGRSAVYSLDQLDDGDVPRITKSREPSIFRAVQTKMDFQAWYHRQSTRDQEIITDLAMSETTTAVAKKYGVTPGAISQRRKAYSLSWNAFINPGDADSAVVA